MKTPSVRPLSAKCAIDELTVVIWSGQTVVHEWSHLTWIKAINLDRRNDPDVYGFEAAAVLARDHPDSAFWNADNYAGFAS